MHYPKFQSWVNLYAVAFVAAAVATIATAFKMNIKFQEIAMQH